jgi:hypothetical protein
MCAALSFNPTLTTRATVRQGCRLAASKTHVNQEGREAQGRETKAWAGEASCVWTGRDGCAYVVYVLGSHRQSTAGEKGGWEESGHGWFACGMPEWVMRALFLARAPCTCIALHAQQAAWQLIRSTAGCQPQQRRRGVVLLLASGALRHSQATPKGGNGKGKQAKAQDERIRQTRLRVAPQGR